MFNNKKIKFYNKIVDFHLFRIGYFLQVKVIFSLNITSKVGYEQSSKKSISNIQPDIFNIAVSSSVSGRHLIDLQPIKDIFLCLQSRKIK